MLIYEILLLALLLYFSFKNSRIPSQLRAHAEEGQAATRLVIVVSVVNIATFVVITILVQLRAPLASFFWTYIASSTVSSSVYLAVIFIPKVCTGLNYWLREGAKGAFTPNLPP